MAPYAHTTKKGDDDLSDDYDPDADSNWDNSYRMTHVIGWATINSLDWEEGYNGRTSDSLNYNVDI